MAHHQPSSGHPTGAAPGVDAGIDAAARRVLDGWLAELAARLPGPASTRAAILTELTDGLHETLATTRTADPGLPPAQVAHAAIAEFGHPATVAAAFAPELAAARARRTACALLATGPLMAAVWLAVIAPSVLPPAQPTWALTGPWLALPLLGALIVVGAHAALLTVAATSRPSRWLPDRPRLAPTAAATATLACALGDVAGLTLLAVLAATGPARLAWLPAATASLTRLILAGRAARHRLTDRAALA